MNVHGADLMSAWAVVQMAFPFPWRVSLHQAWNGGKSRRHRRWYYAEAVGPGGRSFAFAAKTAADALIYLADGAKVMLEEVERSA